MKPSTGAIVACAVISGLSFFVWVIMIATLSDLGHSDAAGNAMASGFAAIEIILLWVLLGVLLLVSGIAGGMPLPAAIAAMILLPASGFAAMLALDLLSNASEPPYQWPLITPALVPPIIVAFCFWTLLSPLRASIPTSFASGSAWGLVLLLCLALWPLGQVRERIEEAAAAQSAKWEADFSRLPADAPLWDWTPFLDTRNYVHQDEVLKAIRKLPDRQAQAEVMLDRGDFPLRYLNAMDLDPTTSLCEKARALLRKQVGPLIAKNPGSRPYYDIAEQVDGALAAMRWLVGYGCSCDAESQAWESMAKGYRDPNFDVHELAELRDPKALGRTLREHPEKFSMLTPQAHLRAWLGFADNKELREQALAGARKLDHRTDDAVAMLDEDEFTAGTVLKYMPALDLEPTAALCNAGLRVLYGDFTHVYRPRSDDPRPYSELLERLGGYEPLTALQWLASHGCDSDAALSEAEDLVRTYQDSPDRTAMLVTLAKLHRKP